MYHIYFQNLANILLFLSVFAWIILLIRTIYIIKFTPSLKTKNTLSTFSPFISILLPVRNESGRVLKQNIESLVNQKYSNFEIVVVDDRSTDDSAIIIKNIQTKYPDKLKFFSGLPPSDNWVGKTHALQQAKEKAQGDWLIAVDADVIFSPYIITSAIDLIAEKRLDALSLLPKVKMESFWEKSVIPIICWLSIMRVSPTQANRKSSKNCFGYGNFIMFSRVAHDAINGFEGYKDNILDDCVIMEKLKSANYRVMVAGGDNLMESRMYKNLAEIIQGFGKNTFAALGYKLWKAVILVLTLILIVYFPIFYLLINSFINELTENYLMTNIAVGAILLNALTIYVFAKKMQASRLSIILWVLGYAIAGYIILYSTIKVISGKGVSWKDRTIKTG